MASAGVWLTASRPKTLGAAVGPVVMGTAAAAAAGGLHIPSAVAALLGALLIQVGTNLANDYFDYKRGADSEERIGPVRVTQAGLVDPPQVLKATVLVYGAAVLVGAYLAARAGWPVVIIGLSSILWGILYTAGPLPLGYVGLADPFVLVYFGPVAVAGTYYVQCLSVDWRVAAVGFAPGLFSVGILTVNNLRDIEGDRRAGKKTLAVRLGRRGARIQYTICILLGALLPLIVGLAAAWPPVRSGALCASVLLAAAPVLRTVWRKDTGHDLNRALAQTGFLLLLLSACFSTGLFL